MITGLPEQIVKFPIVKQAWKPGSLNAFGMQSNYVKKVVFWLHLISRANFYKNTSLNTFAFLSKTLQNYTFGHVCYSEESLQKFIFEHICCSEQTGAKTIFARLYSPCKKVQWWKFDQIYNFRKSTCKILVLTSCLLSLQMSQKYHFIHTFTHNSKFKTNVAFTSVAMGGKIVANVIFAFQQI